MKWLYNWKYHNFKHPRGDKCWLDTLIWQWLSTAWYGYRQCRNGVSPYSIKFWLSSWKSHAAVVNCTGKSLNRWSACHKSRILKRIYKTYFFSYQCCIVVCSKFSPETLVPVADGDTIHIFASCIGTLLWTPNFKSIHNLKWSIVYPITEFKTSNSIFSVSLKKEIPHYCTKATNFFWSNFGVKLWSVITPFFFVMVCTTCVDKHSKCGWMVCFILTLMCRNFELFWI